MHVHRYGALAVPRNAFLQPEAVVELLDDHRFEVRAHVDERISAQPSWVMGRLRSRALPRQTQERILATTA